MPKLDTVPRTVAVGLSVGALGFASGALLWIVERTIMLLWPRFGGLRGAWPSYSWVVEVAIVATTFLCSWRPVPGTRSHVFARVGAGASVVAIAAEEWPIGLAMSRDACGNFEELPSDPPLVVLTLGGARLLLWLSLGGVVLATGRRFALPRWLPAIAAGLGATLAEPGLEHVLLRWQRGSPLFRFPTFTYSLVELVMIVAFAGAFASVASAVRTRSLIDQDAILSTRGPRSGTTERTTRTLNHWSASSVALLVCVFALSSQVGTMLTDVPSLGGAPANGRLVLALSLSALAILVERARRKNPNESSVAPTVAAGLGAACSVMAVRSPSGGGVLALHALALAFCAFTVVAIAMLLPKIPGHSRAVRNVKRVLFGGGVVIALSALSELRSARLHCEVPHFWLSIFDGQSVLLSAHSCSSRWPFISPFPSSARS